MSLVALGMFASVVVLTVLSIILEEVSDEMDDGLLNAALNIVGVSLLLAAMTAVPMFQFNGLLDMSLGVLLSSQVAALVFVIAVAVRR